MVVNNNNKYYDLLSLLLSTTFFDATVGLPIGETHTQSHIVRGEPRLGIALRSVVNTICITKGYLV